ncbi:Sodium/hydrogen exchanger family-domain-containing protein [Boeremia exigua]|uniref:Sodium/hydrogen exchanger family-domain-containing protein n=1 Tax=Boeremia exigua TaxID=749465 RepID=UPI001E8CC6BC|nr:Sodium/hydrogen exchanger family-domain-containing protein [Boeremia exigua]KAH6620076.1 Sodium/hydrogen exchanger family-domain-containing protein [Boeremia exigua]
MSSTIIASAAASATAPPKAPPQGGILEGVNPVHFDKSHPIILFIIQASIIIIFCRVLGWPLSKLRQPRVISEIIGGILLGPSVFGRIPGFTEAIFPTESMTNLNLVANLGLTLFLFIIGLEVDLRFLLSNWKVALNVGVISMAIPFGMGCAIAVGLYNEFKDEPGMVDIDFSIFMLFIGVAMAITAFPVLCRILTELKLLMTPVGVIVLSAGVGNDVVGWILLALCVALVNAGSGLTALWVLLTCAGFMLFLCYAVRPVFIWFLRRSGALQDGPSQGIISLTLIIALGSAFFTGIIGVHPIFGAFMAGLICPHEGGFAIKVAEKIEDLIGALFLPLYFTLSGLNTNVGLLDSGIVWGYVIGVTAVAFFSKFIGASLAARGTKMLWRECFAIGSLMSCKGLVELIVLNIGLNAKILSTRTFTIFVVMALVTTFASSPLTMYFYPPWYQKKVESWRRGEIDWDTGKPLDNTDSVQDGVHADKMAAEKIKRVTVYLRLDSMPNLLAFTSLFGGSQAPAAKVHPSIVNTETADSSLEEVAPNRPVEAYGLRLLNLTDRGSSVMQVSEMESYTAYDPVVNTFRTFGRLHNLAVSGEALVVPESSFADTLATRASESNLLLLPWSETGGMSEQAIIEDKGTKNKLAASSYIAFVNATLDAATTPVAILVNKNFGGSKNKDRKQNLRLTRTYSSVSLHADTTVTAPIADRSHHIFAPFFGGADDRAALRLVLQLAENPQITATIVHFDVAEAILGAPTPSPSSSSTSPTKSGEIITTTATIPSREQDAAFFASLRASLPAELANRVIFDTVPSTQPVADVIARASIEVGQAPKNAGDLIVLGRNIGRNAALGADRPDEIRSAGEAGSSLGVLAERVWEGKVGASLLVVRGGVAGL